MKQCHQIADLLLELERELRRLELWEARQPEPEDLVSELPFAVDKLTFPQWLQFIFIERMGQIVQQGLDLPTVSGVQPMAEEYFSKSPDNGSQVVAILTRFDEIVSKNQAARS